MVVKDSLRVSKEAISKGVLRAGSKRGQAGFTDFSHTLNASLTAIAYNRDANISWEREKRSRCERSTVSAATI